MIKAQEEQTSMEEDSEHGNQEDKAKQKGNRNRLHVYTEYVI